LLKKSEFYIGFYTYELNQIIGIIGSKGGTLPSGSGCARTNSLSRCLAKKEAVSRGNGFSR